MLKKIRVALAAVFITALSLLFLDFTGTLHSYLGWTSKIQFIPAILALNLGVLLALAVLTLLFGRIYCSAICPLGIFQDVVSRIVGFVKKNRFSYRPPKKSLVILRFAILAVFILALVLNIVAITVNLEPYSIYGRIVSQIFAPLYLLGNNILAYFAERAGSYVFYTVDIWLASAVTLAVAIISFVGIAIFAAVSGRGFCNTVCPVGAFLSLASQLCFMKAPVWDKCSGCSLCAKKCKAGCIDTANKKVDYLRCVSCFNCYETCPKEVFSVSWENPFAIKKTEQKPKPQTENLSEDAKSRRGFVSAMSVLALGLFARAFSRGGYQFDGGLSVLEDKRAPARRNPIIPAGADNIRNFRRRCTACQQCVTVCPNQVLRPSEDLSGFMQPHLSFERGFCRPECVKCSQVCPTGAIRPITRAEKSSTQIGYAVWRRELCVVINDEVSCDLCSRRCPTGAITMIPQSAGASRNIPMIDVSRCIGCGSCEQFCPSRPYSAIFVEGVDTHRTI